MADQTSTTDNEFLDELCLRNGYPRSMAKSFGQGFYGIAYRLLLHGSLIVGEIGDFFGYADRWCYASAEAAWAALETWDGNGDAPEGWHRHPGSGRRRVDGDPAQEYLRG